MIAGNHVTPYDPIATCFGQLPFMFCNESDGPRVTSGSYVGDYPIKELAATVDWRGASEVIMLPKTTRISRLRPGFTGSSKLYAGLVVEQTGEAISQPDYEMVGLETAAEAGDERAFVMIWKAMDWRAHPPEDFVRAVRWALAAGAHLAARQLAIQGAECYPGNAELQKFARALNPPRAVRSHLPPDPSAKADTDWFTKYSAEYRGQWVAVKNGCLLGAAITIQALMEIVPEWRKATITQIVW
jgi:hypothetical protein